MGVEAPAGPPGRVIRHPVASGTFYPADPGELSATVASLLENADSRAVPALRALIVPHAGYAYSGPVAASGFALAPRQARVVLLGPSHFVPLSGMAVSSAGAWRTPLGDVEVSSGLREAALEAGAFVDDTPHARDHALEVELPFLQRACPDGLELLPVAVGRSAPKDVARLCEAPDVLVVVSTDLSHYLDDAAAKRADRATADAVLARDPDAIADGAACGADALRGVVELARGTDLEVELLDLRTSADTAGDASRVVGYGAFAMSSSSPSG